jgi:hypothetical protein
MGKEPTIEDVFVLSSALVVETADMLMRRIKERFPGSGLGHAAAAVHVATSKTSQRIQELERPHLVLRAASRGVVLATALLILWLIFGELEWSWPAGAMGVTTFVGVLEPFLGSVVFITAFVAFLSSLEQRWKADRVLEALTELRGLIHVIDMHQLTKDPERARQFGGEGIDTPSSPARDLTSFELGRYLDYCTELLSICAKVAALYAQSFSDTKVLRAVDEIETLATALSMKIWQKLHLLHRTGK